VDYGPGGYTETGPGCNSMGGIVCTDHSQCSPDRVCLDDPNSSDPDRKVCQIKHPSTDGYTTDCGEMCWNPGEMNMNGTGCPPHP
jgi:hypothetical protein